MYQSATPPWPEQAPWRSLLVQYSPSVHRAVAPFGFLPNHFATPPWAEQAPCCVAAEDQVLSLQRAVALASAAFVV